VKKSVLLRKMVPVYTVVVAEAATEEECEKKALETVGSCGYERSIEVAPGRDVWSVAMTFGDCVDDGPVDSLGWLTDEDLQEYEAALRSVA
jgi:hypothetical protein